MFFRYAATQHFRGWSLVYQSGHENKVSRQKLFFSEANKALRTLHMQQNCFSVLT